MKCMKLVWNSAEKYNVLQKKSYTSRELRESLGSSGTISGPCCKSCFAIINLLCSGVLDHSCNHPTMPTLLEQFFVHVHCFRKLDVRFYTPLFAHVTDLISFQHHVLQEIAHHQKKIQFQFSDGVVRWCIFHTPKSWYAIYLCNMTNRGFLSHDLVPLHLTITSILEVITSG